jgi:regulatory protein
MDELYSKKKPSHANLSVKDARQKIAAYCAYQERTQKEVREKLYDYGLPTPVVEEIIADLISENFINEERFAITYAGGKFRIKKWGKIKIAVGLKAKGVSGYCLSQALQSIDDQDYVFALKQIIQKKNISAKEENIFKKKDMLARHAIAKGYEPEAVWQVINEEITLP